MGRKILVSYSTLNPELQLQRYHHGRKGHTGTTTDDDTSRMHSRSIHQGSSLIEKSMCHCRHLIIVWCASERDYHISIRD